MLTTFRWWLNLPLRRFPDRVVKRYYEKYLLPRRLYVIRYLGVDKDEIKVN